MSTAHIEKTPVAQLAERHPFGQARRLVQIVVVLNLFLLSTSVVLPLYSRWRLATLTSDLRDLEKIAIYLEVARRNYTKFFSSKSAHSSDRSAHYLLRNLATQVRAIAGAGQNETPEHVAFMAAIETDWSFTVARWAYVCPQLDPRPMRADLQRTFLAATEVLTQLERRRIGIAGTERSAQLRAAPIEHIVAFDCSMRRIKQVLRDPRWRERASQPRDTVTGRVDTTPFDSAGDETLVELAAFLDLGAVIKEDVFASLPALSARSIKPVNLSTAVDVQEIVADYGEQLVDWRRDQDSARYSVPFIGISVDARTVEYAAIAVALVLLIEAFVFHQSLLALPPVRAAQDQNSVSHYFRSLLLIRIKDHSGAVGRAALRALARAGGMLLTTILLMLLLAVPLLVAAFRLWSPFAGGFTSGDCVFPMLCVALFALVFANLRQLYLLESRTLLDGETGVYLQ